jgi:hypothetical protein
LIEEKIDKNEYVWYNIYRELRKGEWINGFSL